MERGELEGMTRRQQPHRAHLTPVIDRNKATLGSVSIADLKLLTEGKFYEIDSVSMNSDLIISLQK